jgi:hypothetical protein
MVNVLPSPPFHLRGGGPGIGVPLLVVPVDVAVRTRRPGERRYRVDQRTQLCFVLAQSRLGPHPGGDVDSLLEQSVHSALRIDEWLVDEVVPSLLELRPPLVDHDERFARDVRRSRRIHLVQQGQVALLDEIRKHLAKGPASRDGTSDELLVAAVREHERV